MNIFLGILVNFIWGLAFFVPYYLADIDPILIVFSRYFFYGFISVILLLSTNAHWRSLTRLDWKNAMLFSFAGNIGYYLALVLAIHHAGVVLPTLIIGALPITMMVYGNIKNQEFPFHRLILPIILISIGIIGIRWLQYSELAPKKDMIQMMIGTMWSLLALAIWTWYGVTNANYLKKNFTISGNTWSIAIGICCLIQVILLFPIVILSNRESVLTSLGNFNSLYQIILGGFILGVVVSWLATIWWNKISRQLPTLLIGQLLVFETIASLLYGYVHDHVFPQVGIFICISIVLLGIILGIRVTILKKSHSENVVP